MLIITFMVLYCLIRITIHQEIRNEVMNSLLIKNDEYYGIANVDGHKVQIGNYRIEPPVIFFKSRKNRKAGSLRQRVQPEDVIINCSKY